MKSPSRFSIVSIEFPFSDNTFKQRFLWRPSIYWMLLLSRMRVLR